MKWPFSKASRELHHVSDEESTLESFKDKSKHFMPDYLSPEEKFNFSGTVIRKVLTSIKVDVDVFFSFMLCLRELNSRYHELKPDA